MADYCFHSFPRPRTEESRARLLLKGEMIAKSILENGLLLAPEHFEIPLLDGSGVQIDKLEITQCRICFTEIPASELETHSQNFGPFSVAYDIDDLRRIGGLPVHYVPLPYGTHLYGLGSQILAGIADGLRLVEALAKIRHQMEQSSTLGLVWTRRVNGEEVRDGVRFNEEQTSVLRSFFDEFEKMCSLHLGLTHQKLLAAAASFYPTEHPTRTGKLHYYRQREWRIVECGLTQNGQPLAPRARDTQFLIDPQFGRIEEFSEDFAAVWKAPNRRRDRQFMIIFGGKWGFIRNDTSLAIDTEFERVKKFTEGVAAANFGTRYDERGVIVDEGMGIHRHHWKNSHSAEVR